MSKVYNYSKENHKDESQVQQLIDYFGLAPETETGNDGYEYQNYIVFPYFSDYMWEDIENISEIFNISLNIDSTTFPFGKIKNISDEERKEINNLNPEIKKLFVEKVMEYPNEEDVMAVIKEIFEDAGVLFGTIYELDGGSFPEEYNLFQGYEDINDFQLYDLDLLDNNKNNNVVEYRNKIQNIISSFNETEDALIKKSLLFAAFSTNEAFIRARISAKMPNLTAITGDTYLTKIITKKIETQLQTSEGRKKLFNHFYSSDDIHLVPVDKNLRNLLAHDIDSLIVKGDEITFTDYSKENPDGYQRTCNMLDVLEYLKEHPTRLYPNNIDETNKQSFT